MNSEPIYISRPRFENSSYFIVIILCAFAIGYLLLHFYQNPIVIGVIISILLFIILGGSRDIVVVREEYFEFLFIRMVPFLSTSKKIMFDEVESIEADLPLTESRSIFSDLMAMFSPNFIIIVNKITIKCKDGRIKRFATSVYRDDIHAAFKFVEKLSKVPIVINDVPFS